MNETRADIAQPLLPANESLSWIIEGEGTLPVHDCSRKERGSPDFSLAICLYQDGSVTFNNIKQRDPETCAHSGRALRGSRRLVVLRAMRLLSRTSCMTVLRPDPLRSAPYVLMKVLFGRHGDIAAENDSLGGLRCCRQTSSRRYLELAFPNTRLSTCLL